MEVINNNTNQTCVKGKVPVIVVQIKVLVYYVKVLNNYDHNNNFILSTIPPQYRS